MDAELEDIDEEIAELEDALAGCRRAILASRAAAWIGGATLLLAITFVVSLRTPTIVIGAIAAAIGGTVWGGATASSRAEIEERLAETEARKARLFDMVAARNGWRDMTRTVH